MELPSGTVTLLLTQVEGPTRLLLRSRRDYDAALDLQRSVLREACRAHAGVEMGTGGASFTAVFPSAPDAAAAAVSAQRQLVTAIWPGHEPMRVQMGIHTGTPMRHADGYVGVDVDMVGLVAAAANGGQVLVSEATASLVRGHDDFELRDLGRHQLRDRPQPERLFQLLADGFPVVSTAVRTLGSTPNLPTPATPLVGRHQELADVLELLRQPQGRLVTLTGPGGTGKTRLAVAVGSAAAAEHERGVYFVPLEAVTRGDDMWAGIAAALNFQTKRRAIHGLLEYLRHKDPLLILDNLEQIKGADAVVAELLASAPGVRVIATSRHPLHVEGEQEYPVPPLAIPKSVHDGDAASVQLMVLFARRFRPAFTITAVNRPAIIDICRRLEGMPLALEIASARLGAMSPSQLLHHLDRALDLHGAAHGRRPSRHQTLRQTIAWSHDLLTPRAQRLFRCLSVFGGEAAVAGVEWVWTHLDTDEPDITGSDAPTDTLAVLEQLVDSSLVRMQIGTNGVPRVSMLTTVLAFAAEQLEASPDSAVAHQAAVEFYNELSQGLLRDRSPGWRARLTDGLEIEQRGYRRCLDWLLDRITHLSVDDSTGEGQVALALQMTFRYCFGLLYWRRRYQESSRLLEQVLAAAQPRTGLRVGSCLAETAALALDRGDIALAETRIQAARHSAADTATDTDLDAVEAEFRGVRIDNILGYYLSASGHLAEYRELAEHQVATVTNPALKPVAAYNLAMAEYEQGLFEDCIGLCREATALAVAAGDELIANGSQYQIACALRHLGRPEDANREFQAIGQMLLAERDPLGDAELAEDYAAVLIELGRWEEAGLLMGAAEAARERLNVPREAAQQQDLDGALEAARLELGPRWDSLLDEGRALPVEELLRRAFSTPPD